MNPIDLRLEKIVAAQPYPFVFATISGEHLYEFVSADSDYDLRGAHVLPAEGDGRESIEERQVIEGLEMDIVSHDVRKFFGLLLEQNGYALEQLYSPLVVKTTRAHTQLKYVASGCITRGLGGFYLELADLRWHDFQDERSPRNIKWLLYVYRALLVGIWLMKTGVVVSSLAKLNESFQLPHLDVLIEKKRLGSAETVVDDSEFNFHKSEYVRLREELEKARAANEGNLREEVSDETRARMAELLQEVRIGQ